MELSQDLQSVKRKESCDINSEGVLIKSSSLQSHHRSSQSELHMIEKVHRMEIMIQGSPLGRPHGKDKNVNNIPLNQMVILSALDTFYRDLTFISKANGRIL